MWFKKAIIYHLSQQFPPARALEGEFHKLKHQPIGNQESVCYGWSPVLKNTEGAPLIYFMDHVSLFCMRKEEKQIPASIVKEALDHRVASIEQDEGRKVYGKEKTALKDDILSLLKPKAMAKATHVYGYVDIKRNILVVNGSPNQADAFVELLIETIGSLGAVKLMGEKNPATVMNDWVLGTPPEGIELTGDFKLEDPKEYRAVSIKSDHAHIDDLLEDGYWIKALGIKYGDYFTANFEKSLTLSGIKFRDEILKARDELDSETMSRFNADMKLMTETIGHFYQSLIYWFEINQDKE